MPRPSRRQTFGLGAGAVLATGLPATAAEAPAGEPSFSLLLVNDVYQMAEIDGRGGFPRLNAVVKAERARGVPMLYAHAGDTLSPSLMSGFDKGAHIVALLNLAPPDVFVPGNHEFDFGPDTFAERMREAFFPVFAANLQDADGKPLPNVGDRRVVILGGIRVGVVGIALASTPEKSQSGALRFLPELESLAEQCALLRSEGAEIIVAVAHTARPTDLAIVASGQVDILLSGHDHDLLVHYDGAHVLVESSVDAHYVTSVDVRVQVTGEGKARRVSWRPSFRIHDTASVAPDPETLALVRHYESGLSQELDVPVGETLTPLDSRIVSVRAEEASFGDLVADALRASTGAEAAITNGGGIRGNRLYPAGSVLSRRDILTELPFGNTTVLVAITGAQVMEALENGLTDLGRPAGRFAQVSGLVVGVDASAPAGRRVASVMIGGEPLDAARSYRVATNSFLYDGGNGLRRARPGPHPDRPPRRQAARQRGDGLSPPARAACHRGREPHRDEPMTGPVRAAVDAFRSSGSAWAALPFFADGAADAVAARVDERIAQGAQVLPSPKDIFQALSLTPLESVKAVILGQDPYPTPGDANGLAFSYVGARRLPASLKVILAETSDEPPRSGDLSPWARQGVLLLNTALTVEAGNAGAHLRLGWTQLADEAVAAVSAGRHPVVFLLWGAPARARAGLIDASRHAVLESGHPSPLNRARDFPGSRPFSRANTWLAERGLAPIDWRIG